MSAEAPVQSETTDTEVKVQPPAQNTPEGSPKPEGQDSTEQSKKWAGIYESPEKLEEGYKNSAAELTRKSQEAAYYKRRAEELEAAETKPESQPETSEPNLINELREEYGESPPLEKMAKKLEAFEEFAASQKRDKARDVQESYAQDISKFEQENPDLAGDPVLLNKVIGELNVLLSDYGGYRGALKLINSGVATKEQASFVAKMHSTAVRLVNEKPAISPEREAADKTVRDMAGSAIPPADVSPSAGAKASTKYSDILADIKSGDTAKYG